MSHNLSSPLPLLPLRGGVLFPGTTVAIPVGREKSRRLLDHRKQGDLVVVGVQRDPDVAAPGFTDLQPIATLARIHRVVRRGPRLYQALLEGVERVELVRFEDSDPYTTALVRSVQEPVSDPDEVRELKDELCALIDDVAGDLPDTVQKVVHEIASDENVGRLADRAAGAIRLPFDKEVHVLLTLDVEKRLKLVLKLLSEARTLSDVREKIDADVRKEAEKMQREAYLRQQLKAIQKELGDDDEEDGDKLKQRLADKDLPEEVRKVVDKELKRLAAAQGPEAGVIRNYLEWIAEIPWNERSENDASLDAVAQKLDEDHAGLHEPKKRILEHLAVSRLAGTSKARTILCLAGPPGVGKTSIGQSVADALGRPFVRISLGGVRDEAEVRGHRRTYVGALPGRILHGLKKAGVKNPVMLLDEIDKLGRGWAGDPEAALLEVLDPEQNHTFTDHYLELPVDLSEVLFLCTANDLDQLSAPLRDRLEIIELSGYPLEEKVEIAKTHLIPKKLAEHGIDDGMLSLSDEALDEIVSRYTREAGVRQLQRQITKLCRALALEIAKRPDQKPVPLHVDAQNLAHYLGKPRFFLDVAERTSLPGVATGLAWTPVGGDILFIESSKMKGQGRVETTGQLGDVMKESARAALTYVRSHSDELGIDESVLEKSDIHIHVPAGAVPKDGPSAGVTMFSALVSLLTGKKVRSDTAMTGEVTLRGRVLPVGGIKSKVLAAHRAGLTRVILPAKNERDLDDIPEAVREQLDIVLASEMSEVLAAALEVEPSAPLATTDGGQREVTTAQLH